MKMENGWAKWAGEMDGQKPPFLFTINAKRGLSGPAARPPAIGFYKGGLKYWPP
jgi:hypothetical protein